MTTKLSTVGSGLESPRVPFLAAAFGLSLLCLPVPATAAPLPAIAFGKDAVVASGVTAGGRVVWFGVAREIEQRSATIVRRQAIAGDDDGDGVVRLELERDVPLQSIWVAVDLQTGKAALATPEGYPLRRSDLPQSSARRGGDRADWIADTRGYVEILLVRPTESAWGATVGDGGDTDDDGDYDGLLKVSLPHLQGIDRSSADAPERFTPGDLLIVIDPNQMVVGLLQLAKVAP